MKFVYSLCMKDISKTEIQKRPGQNLEFIKSKFHVIEIETGLSTKAVRILENLWDFLSPH